ncbi:hypothetical protein ACFU96_34720 [Streptomyces sp. NPDC057620]|uniref:hypothetical protein n=1 Tax=Streptomyces sp. NPDC057620 TaxID=3346185 RepID=UPI00369B1525
MTAERAVLGMGLPSFCLVYVRDVPAKKLIRRLGIDSNAPEPRTWSDSDSLVQCGRPGSLLRFGTAGRWSFCFETWGTATASDGGLLMMSAGTEALSYLSSGNGMDIVQRWDDAQPAELFEPAALGSLRARHSHPLRDTAQHHRNALADPHRGRHRT